MNSLYSSWGLNHPAQSSAVTNPTAPHCAGFLARHTETAITVAPGRAAPPVVEMLPVISRHAITSSRAAMSRWLAAGATASGYGAGAGSEQQQGDGGPAAGGGRQQELQQVTPETTRPAEGPARPSRAVGLGTEIRGDIEKAAGWIIGDQALQDSGERDRLEVTTSRNPFHLRGSSCCLNA